MLQRQVWGQILYFNSGWDELTLQLGSDLVIQHRMLKYKI